MPSTWVVSSKKQAVWFVVFFVVAAILSYITWLLDGTTGLSRTTGPLITTLSLAVLLPLMVVFHIFVRPIRVLLYFVMHVVFVMLVLFYIGPYNPIMTGWLLLCVVTYLEFGFPGLVLSSVTLLGVSVDCTYLFIYPTPQLGQNLFYNSMFCMILVLCAYIIAKVLQSSERGRYQLEEVRKSEMAQLTKLSTVLNSIGDAILTLDSKTRVTSQNSAALGFFDTNESLIGRHIDELLHIVDDEQKPINIQELILGVERNTMRDDVMIQSKDQGTMRLSLQISPIYVDNQHQGVVLVIRDITKQKTLEEEKDEFISVASHELRTPIAVAEASLSNLVLMQEKGMDPSKLGSAAATAHDEVIYLAGVVNDLSTLSRAERGVADTPEPVDLDQLFHELYAKYEPDAQKKHLHLNLDLKGKLPVVEVSRLYIEEILQNFITNAIKYTQKGAVTLHAEVVDGGVRCAVSDNGIGISKSDQKHIFERFWRSEDYRTRETNGTGLGLYVVHKLADKIGTKIEFESRLNHGSTFAIVVPIKSSILSTGKRSVVNE